MIRTRPREYRRRGDIEERGEEVGEKCREADVTCILFDGWIDLTNVMLEAEGRVFPHLFLQVLPESLVATTVSVLPRKKATKEQSRAEQITKVLFAWLRETGFDKTLWTIGDNGVKARVMQCW